MTNFSYTLQVFEALLQFFIYLLVFSTDWADVHTAGHLYGAAPTEDWRSGPVLTKREDLGWEDGTHVGQLMQRYKFIALRIKSEWWTMLYC